MAALVLAVHRRNGGTLEALDWSARLLAPELGLDSLDLAEIMAGVERAFGVEPFAGERPPETWGEVLEMVVEAASRRSGEAG